MPLIIYKIIFIVTAFGAGVIATNLLMKREKRTPFDVTFGLMSLFFVVWAASRFALLIVINGEDALMWAHILYNGSILVHILFLHTILILLSIDKTKFNKIILLFFYGLGGILLIFNNLYFLTGDNYLVSGVAPQLNFGFFEIPDSLYNLHLVNYFVIPFYSFILLIKEFLQTIGRRKRQILWILGASFVGFIGGNSVVPLIFGFQIQPLPLILLPFYLPIMTYAITRYNLFNIRTMASEVFTLILWTAILVRIFISDNPEEQFFNVLLLILTLIAGVFLIRSVQKEVDQREKIEKLADELGVANKKLKELDQIKSEFVSFATHQIRAPITSISGYASLILEGDYGVLPENIKEPLTKITQSSRALASIVEDFLNISRIELGRMQYNYEVCNITKLVRDTADDLKPTIEGRGLSIKVTLPNEPITIKADSGKIKQVLNNLIDNGIKYTEKGGVTITLVPEKDRDTVLISITDTGRGIEASVMPKLFQKFSRADDARRANILGTGLGLYLAKELVHAHDGEIWAQSAGAGKGTTFFIRLPLDSADSI